MMKPIRRYDVTLPPELDEQLAALSEKLGVSRGEVLERALRLLQHAAEADRVQLVTAGVSREVKVK